MQSMTQQDIAARAYQLWEEEGRPHGKDLDHWTRAMSELSSNDNGIGTVNGATVAAASKAKATKKAAAKPADPEAPAKPKRKTAKAGK